jgi:hypothetical protein
VLSRSARTSSAPLLRLLCRLRWRLRSRLASCFSRCRISERRSSVS